MYIFMLMYPVLMFYVLRALGLLSNNIFSYIKNIGLFWILPFPVIVLMMRIFRSISDTKFGIGYVVMQFFEITIFPVVIFWYIFSLTRKKIHSNKENTTIALSEYIVFIPLVNYFCITIANILINNTYFNWIDILLYPLIRMTMIQILIILLLITKRVIITTVYEAHQKEHPSKSYKQYILYYEFVGIYILFGLLCALIIMFSRNEEMFIGGILSFIIVLLGYISVIVYRFYNKSKAEVVQL